MNRDEILSMEPGRELDALVAEKVMGWTYGHPCPEGMDCLHWVDEKGKVRDYKPPQYSTDISAAWEVEAAAMEIDRLEYVAALMQVVWNDMNYIELADPDNMTAWQAIPDLLRATPEQRCKAALLAVMDGEDEAGEF